MCVRACLRAVRAPSLTLEHQNIKILGGKNLLLLFLSMVLNDVYLEWTKQHFIKMLKHLFCLNFWVCPCNLGGFLLTIPGQ